MEYDGETLVVDRTPSELDEIVLEFTEILDEENIEYAIVSGYVAILTGRSRATEDIDIVTSVFLKRGRQRSLSVFKRPDTGERRCHSKSCSILSTTTSANESPRREP